jgi:ABC-type transport system involved in Fe-S cluster assembly fused permease/ATPase subunit
MISMNILSEFVLDLSVTGTGIFFLGIILTVAAFIAVRLVLRDRVKVQLAKIYALTDVIVEPDDTQNARKAALTLDEEPFLFDTTVFDNIKYGKISASDEEVAAAAERAGIAYLIEEETPANLTKGERQLVAAARAVLFRPREIIVGRGLSAVDLLKVKELDI